MTNQKSNIIKLTPKSVNDALEFTATDVRKIIQKVYPSRRLVLSQFTFFNDAGISSPTGTQMVRGRGCYRLHDLLPIATVIALKDRGITYKKIQQLPSLIQQHSHQIFKIGAGCRVNGFGSNIEISIPGLSTISCTDNKSSSESTIDQFIASLDSNKSSGLYWSLDIGKLASDLQMFASELFEKNDSANKASNIAKVA